MMIINLHFLFTAAEVKKINAVVYGVLEGVPIPFPLPNPDGCTNSGLKCPLEKGTPYKYHSIIPVKKIYPAVSLANNIRHIRSLHKITTYNV